MLKESRFAGEAPKFLFRVGIVKFTVECRVTTGKAEVHWVNADVHEKYAEVHSENADVHKKKADVPGRMPRHKRKS